MVEKKNYLWLEDFWQKCIVPRPDRRWEIVSAVDGDFMLRDGYAHELIRQQLSTRLDVDYRYFRAREAYAGDGDLRTKVDFFLLGRPLMFASTYLSPLVGRLEGKAYGRFSDADVGLGGRSVNYGNKHFRRHELEETLEEYHRYDRDYGFFLYRCETVSGEERIFIAVAGIGALGTLGLTTILSDDKQRQQLVQQLQEVAPLSKEHRPERHIEMGVRIQVSGHEGLVHLLNNNEEKKPSFSFEIEVVAVQTVDGSPDIRFAEHPQVELRLSRLKEELPSKRFLLLQCLAEGPGKVSLANLYRRLGFVKSGRKSQPDNQERFRLAKLVHDLNADLRKKGFARDRNARLIHFDKTQKCYVLEGVRIIN